MSTHIGAPPGRIAPVVLLPGDPLRARWIAENFLDDATCYTEVRGMYGFTGTCQGTPVSVQGSGMGQPSMSIYVNELFRDHDVSSVVRVHGVLAVEMEACGRRHGHRGGDHLPGAGGDLRGHGGHRPVGGPRWVTSDRHAGRSVGGLDRGTGLRRDVLRPSPAVRGR